MSEADKTSKPNTEAAKPDAPATAKPGATAAAAKSSNKVIYIVVGVIAALVLIPAILMAVGIGIVGHKIGSSVKVSNDGKTATIKTANGDEITSGSTKTLPKDFPSSVTVYKGTILNSSRLTIDGKVNWSVTIETTDSAAKVGEALSQSFSTDGWVAALDNKTSDGGLIAADNTSANLHTQVIYATKDGKTSISYVVVPTTSAQ